MPGLDGPSVLNLLRSWPEDSRPCFIAVVSTCLTDPGLTAGVKLLGADAAHAKPLSYADAEQIVDLVRGRALVAA